MTGLSANARRVLEARYLLRDREPRLIETPGEMFERVARAVGAGRRGGFVSLGGALPRAARRGPQYYDHASRCDPEECRL
jgi:ribonucleotide reductase alpha subunit